MRIPNMAAAAALLSGLSTLSHAAQPKSPPGIAFEYAYLDPSVDWHLTKSTSVAGGFEREYSIEMRVCYLESGGCRWESYREALLLREPSNFTDPIGPSSDTAWASARTTLTARTVYTLGQKGWELVGDTLVPGYWTPNTNRVLWFKRTAPVRRP